MSYSCPIPTLPFYYLISFGVTHTSFWCRKFAFCYAAYRRGGTMTRLGRKGILVIPMLSARMRHSPHPPPCHRLRRGRLPLQRQSYHYERLVWAVMEAPGSDEVGDGWLTALAGVVGDGSNVVTFEVAGRKHQIHFQL